MNENETPLGFEDATHFLEHRNANFGGHNVDEVTRKDSIKRSGGIGQAGDTAQAESITVVLVLSSPTAGPCEHGRGDIHALGPARGIAREKGAEGQSGSNSDLQEVLSILDIEPTEAQASSPSGNPGNQAIIDRGQSSVDALDGAERWTERVLCHDSNKGMEEPRAGSTRRAVLRAACRGRNLRND